MADKDLSSLFDTDVKKFQGVDDENKYFTLFKTQKNQNVYSTGDGIVTSVKNSDKGYTVKIKYNINSEEIEIKYQYLTSVNVTNNNNVYQGQLIGTVSTNMKLYIFNKTTNKTEEPKRWFRNPPENLPKTFVPEKGEKENPNEKITTKDTTEKPVNQNREERKRKFKDFGIGNILGLPFTLVGKGIESMTKRGEKEKEKEKEEKNDDLAPDIQFEQYNHLVSEEIQRIKELMK